MCRAGQNRIYTPYMTVYMVISLPKIPNTHRIYMVLANPMYMSHANFRAISKTMLFSTASIYISQSVSTADIA
jgi:hypothetical protein